MKKCLLEFIYFSSKGIKNQAFLMILDEFYINEKKSNQLYIYHWVLYYINRGVLFADDYEEIVKDFQFFIEIFENLAKLHEKNHGFIEVFTRFVDFLIENQVPKEFTKKLKQIFMVFFVKLQEIPSNMKNSVKTQIFKVLKYFLMKDECFWPNWLCLYIHNIMKINKNEENEEILLFLLKNVIKPSKKLKKLYICIFNSLLYESESQIDLSNNRDISSIFFYSSVITLNILIFYLNI